MKNDIGKIIVTGLLILGFGYFAVLVIGAFRVTDTVIDREVVTNSQGYVDGQVAALSTAYNEYTRLNMSSLESQWCQRPDCDRVALLEGYALAKQAQILNMERIVGIIPSSEVPQEITDLLNGE